MFIQRQPALTPNVAITYSENEYVAFTDPSTLGLVFTQLGVDITAGVSNISTTSFISEVLVQGDQSNIITDENGNVFFLVESFTTVGAIRPTRL